MTLSVWTTVVPRKDKPTAAMFVELDEEAQDMVRSSMRIGVDAGHVAEGWQPDQVKVEIVKNGPHYEIRAVWSPPRAA